MKNDQSDSNAMINKLVKQRLSQSEKDLGDRHHARLEQMTVNAVAQYRNNNSLKNNSLKNTISANYKNSNNRHIYIRPLTFPLALAGSVLFVFLLWWPDGQQDVTENKPTVANGLPSNAVMPEWVLDTSVPVSLLINPAFYDWLDKQADKHNHG